ncbi:MAG: hypothetical protein ACK5O1_04015 [Holosporales bacterium]|jgi:hypothetical protein
MSLSNDDDELNAIKSFLKENQVFILNNILLKNQLRDSRRSIIEFFTSSDERTQRIQPNYTWGDFAEDYKTNPEDNLPLRELLGTALDIKDTSLHNLGKIKFDIETVRKLAGVPQGHTDPSVKACYLAITNDYKAMCGLYGPATTDADNESRQKRSILEMAWTINDVKKLGRFYTDFLAKILPELEEKTLEQAIYAVRSSNNYTNLAFGQISNKVHRDLGELFPDIPQDKDKVYTATELVNSLLKTLKIPKNGYSMIKAQEMINQQNQRTL